MTDKISQARQRLRDYAREVHEIELSTQPGWVSAPVGARVGVARGEAAGKVFVALQEALRVAEELRAESQEPGSVVEVGGRKVTFPEAGSYKDALAAAADRIEATVFLALAY